VKKGGDKMKQLEDKKLCKLCIGCNKLEDENFDGVMRCEGFIPGYEYWKEKYIKNIRENK
jgi:hypothetical protein